MKFTPDYTVIYNDDDIVVLNKRSGLLIAADRYDEDAPRLDLLAEKEFGKLFAVHRIDKDTSGCVIYAKNADSPMNGFPTVKRRPPHSVFSPEETV